MAWEFQQKRCQLFSMALSVKCNPIGKTGVTNPIDLGKCASYLGYYNNVLCVLTADLVGVELACIWEIRREKG